MSNARELAELGGAYSTGGYPHFKNRLINSDMRIDQRNAGASVTNINGTVYTVDRWGAAGAAASKYTAQQSTTVPTSGFKNSLVVTSSSSYTVGASEAFTLRQAIEGFNASDLNWGTASAASVTLSFWVRSSLTGTFGGSLINNGFDRSYPFSYTISAANTWEQKSVTIAGDTSGTWATNSDAGIRVMFGLGAGSSASNTAGTWAAGNYQSATGATSVVGTSGATFYITGVQLEKGSTATSFDYRPYGTELALCQRYYWKATGSNDTSVGSGLAGSATTATVYIKLPVAMRATPSASSSLMAITDAVNYNAAVTSISSIVGGTDNIRLNVAVSGGGMTQYRPALMTNFGSGSYVDFSAEL